MTPPRRQLNLRLPEDTMDLLDAAAFLAECSPQELLTPAVRSVIEELAKDPAVRRVVEARRERRGRGLDRV